MRKFLAVSVILLGTSICLPAQELQDKLEVPHVHNSPALIDGAKNPELIPDVTAYRLFFVAVSHNPTAVPEEKARHANLAKRVRLADADNEALASLMATFRAQYDELTRAYNEDVQAAVASGATPDVSIFFAKRDALVLAIVAKIKGTMTTEGATALHTFIQHEKAGMRIQSANGAGQ